LGEGAVNGGILSVKPGRGGLAGRGSWPRDRISHRMVGEAPVAGGFRVSDGDRLVGICGGAVAGGGVAEVE